MLKLMIAEDEILERKALKYLLNKYYKDKIDIVAEVPNGEEAFSKAIKQKIDIVLMDIRMPKMDGLRAAQLIKEEYSESEIIILTAHSEFEYARKSIHIGVSDYLVKPYLEKEFCSVLDKTIEDIVLKNKRKKRQEELRLQLNNIRPILEKEIILEIIYGTKSSLDKFNEHKKLLGIKSNRYMCLVISSSKKGVFNMESLFKVKQKIKNIQLGVIAYIGFQDMVILLLEDNLKEIKESRNFKDLLLVIKNEFKYYYNTDITIGQSEIYNTSNKLYQSYNEAKSKLVNKKNIENKWPYEMEKIIYRKIFEKNLEATIKEFNNMFSFLVKNSINNIDELKNYFIEFSIVLNRNIREFISEKGEVINIGQIKNDINSFADIRDIKLYLQNLFKVIISEKLKQKKDKKVQVIESVKSYIKENFNEDISLSEVADYISFSQYYLSKLFKEVEGVNFKDYLIKLRMEEAKVLLKQGKKISNVAEAVGYSDPNYFSRAFKKYTGISPSEYI